MSLRLSRIAARRARERRETVLIWIAYSISGIAFLGFFIVWAIAFGGML